MKLLDRWRCHRSLLCCQYVDFPLCNGSLEPHRWARLFRYRPAKTDHKY